MPLEKSLNIFPYRDDYDPFKHYYRVLFKPGVAVQTRELNVLQDILQDQIEQFGDTVYKTGSIIEGCNFTFLNPYQYVKLVDNEINGPTAVPSKYVGFFLKNASNVQAMAIDYADGFQSTAPNLKTLYLNYNNAGQDGNTFTFSPGDAITVFDGNNSIWAVDVNAGGLNFANTDTLVITPAVVVSMSTGSFANGDYVSQTGGQANLQIVNIDSTTLSPQGQVILYLQPRNADLANGTLSSTSWTFANNQPIKNSGNTATGTVLSIVGENASGGVVTDGVGKIIETVVTNRGRGYLYVPVARVRSPNNTTGLTSLTLSAKNWLARVQLANTVDAVGNGYAFGVSEGTIFQKGFFLRVDPQVVIVDKYDQEPNSVSAVFQTVETFVDYNIDTSLLDNATGEENDTAPGADRLELTPTLAIVNTDVVTQNSALFAICKWSEGNPFQQQSTTAYSRLGDAMALRTFEQSGTFVVDPFLVNTKSVFNSNNEGAFFTIGVDPGLAYIDGYRVQTQQNYLVDDDKGTDTFTSNVTVGLNYGNWIRVNNLGGVFLYSTGDTVQLRSAAQGYLSSTTLINAQNMGPAGSLKGTARIRSLVHENGIPGTANATYRAYLFDIQMNTGANFADVKSIFYNGASSNGVADVVTVTSPTTGGQVAQLQNTDTSSLLFSAGCESLLNAANVSYTYRTIDQTLTCSNGGILTKTIASIPNEFFQAPPGAMSLSSLQDLYVVPLVGMQGSPNLTGNVTINTTSNVVTGSGTTFLTDVQAGDFVYIYANSSTFEVRLVTQVVNSTYMTVDSNGSFAQANLSFARYFPATVPVPFGLRSGLTGNVDANGNILTLNFGMSFVGSTSSNVAVGVNINRRNVTAGAKLATRTKFVKICLANNAGGTTGPWCVGVPDAIRLTGVYIGDSTVDTTASNSCRDFYLDHNQNTDFLDLAYLHIDPQAPIALTSAEYLLVQFDYLTVSANGFMDSVSYLGANADQIFVNDSKLLANLGSAMNSFEVPELYSSSGGYIDLLGQFDFRPISANSVAPGSNSSTAPLNPNTTISFGNTSSPANDKKFPLPDSTLTASVTQWVGRVDSVFAGDDGNIFVLQGAPSVNPKTRQPPQQPPNTLFLNSITIAPYPNLPVLMSRRMTQIASTYMGSEKYSITRQQTKLLSATMQSNSVQNFLSQPQRYTMEQIGSLDRRISALEYYQELSLLETDVTTRVIPSSANGSINRFKFGFFVDDFKTGVSQDTNNPQYMAQIFQSQLYPDSISWGLRHGGPVAQHRAYTDFKVVGQTGATETTAIVNCVANGIATDSWALRVGPGQSGQGDIAKVRMASTPQSAALYIDSPNFPTTVDIYQGNTLLFTGAQAVALTSDDKTRLHSNTVPSSWFDGVNFSSLSVSGDTVQGSGKITWTHNPNNGQEYTVITNQSQFNPAAQWRYALEYFTDSSVISCSGITPNNSPYTGSLTAGPDFHYVWILNADTGSVAIPNGVNPAFAVYQWGGHVTRTPPPVGFGGALFIVPNQHFMIGVNGLKPNSVHNFFVNGVDKTGECAQIGKGIGSGLMSDSNGNLQFVFYFSIMTDQDIDPAEVPITDYMRWVAQFPTRPDPQGMWEYTAKTGVLSLTVAAPGSSAVGQLAVLTRNIQFKYSQDTDAGDFGDDLGFQDPDGWTNH